MNQILYKGEIFGGVGEDVTNKHHTITLGGQEIETIGGKNSEIFNNYKGQNINIAEGNNSTVIGYKNIEAKIKQQNDSWVRDNLSVLNNNFIGGENNIVGSYSKDNFVYGIENVIIGKSNAQVAKGNIISGEGNIVLNCTHSIIGGRSNNINGISISCLGVENEITGNYIYCLGDNNTINGRPNTLSIGQYLNTNGEQGENTELLLGKYNALANKLLILGNGTADNNRSNALEIGYDGSQVITLKYTDVTGLGIGKITINQQNIIFESLKANSNQIKETVEFTFEDLKQIKQISQLPNLDNNSYPIPV